MPPDEPNQSPNSTPATTQTEAPALTSKVEPATTPAVEGKTEVKTEAKAEVKPEVKVEALVPLETKDITLPEGYEVDEPVMKDFLALLNNREMSPKDLANKLVELQINQQKTASEKGSKEFADLMTKWQGEVMSDPEIGGAKWAGNHQAIGRLLDKYGSNEARVVFETTGAGNNVHLIRMLLNMAKDLPVSEGKFVPAGAAGQGERTHAETLYPNQGKT